MRVCPHMLRAGVMSAFDDGRLLVRTLRHRSDAPLPSTGSATLIWPHRNMTLYGPSTTRMCVLYDAGECEVIACYPLDARTTVTSDHASHHSPITMEQLRALLQAASPEQTLNYNEVTLKALRGNPNAPADAVAAVNTILLAMYLVPEGMVLWHAEKAGLAINTVDWLPTSAVREGAEYWAARNLSVPYTVHKLIVGQGVRGVAVGSDPFYEPEKEVLLQPGLMVERLPGDDTWEVLVGLQG
jgi:hypothetical protein